MIDTSSAGPFRLQRVFAIAFGAFRARWAPMLVAAFLLGYLPAVAAQTWLTPHYTAATTVDVLHPPAPPPTSRATSTAQPDHAGHLGPWEMFVDAGPLVTLLLLFLTGTAQTAAVTSLTVSSAQRDRAPWRRAARDTAVNFLPLVLIAVIVTTLVAVGSVVVFPGLMIGAAWAVAGPVQVGESPGVLGALRRSADLTRGHRWIVLSIVAGSLATYVALGIIATAVSDVLGLPTLARLDAQVVGTFESLAYDVLIAALYLELRRAREAVAVGQLDHVFA